MSFESNVILVVCQKSKIEDWVNHFRDNYNLTTFDLTNKKQYEEFFGSVGRFVGVVNYDLIFRRKDFLNLKNFTLILDESSLICNKKAHRTKFIMKLKPENVIMLSGTICNGKYENLWSQLHLLGWDITNKLYESQYVNWKNIFVGGMIHKIVDKADPYKNVERLKQKMREYGTVFQKTEEVFDLPEQNFIEVKVPTTKKYRKFLRNKIVTVDGIDFVGDSTLSFRLYQRQLCTAYNPHKIQAFKDLLESTQDRLIVFYQFNCELEQLQKVCAELDRPTSVINGSQRDLTAYEDESNSVTLIQYQSGSFGLNMQKANKTVYFSLTESAEVWMQAHKRTNRIGQTKPCFYYILVSENSIEEKILDCLERGVDFTDDLFAETV
jgi:SNF2 family DNA or RNA helicase